MARIDIDSPSGGGSLASGVLQLQNGVAMDATLRNVADQANTVSPLKLSTTIVQVTSPLRITTDDASDFYLDCEDGSTNNRFSIKRNTASQQVNLDFASNPGGSPGIVGAIRTFKDNINLSEVMTFQKDGNVGFSTNSPIARTHIKGSGSTSATTSLLVQNSAGTNNATFGDNGEVSLILDRTGKGLQLIDNLATTQSSSYYQRGGVAEVITSTSALNYFWWGNNNTSFPNGVFAYNNGVFIVSSTQKNLDSASAASAVLQADSTTRGFLPPRMTTAQKNAIATPVAGLMIYDTNLNKLCVYTGASFETITSV